jgi:hypothetical protein
MNRITKKRITAVMAFVLLLVGLPGIVLSADTIKWVSYEEGLAQGKIENKNIMLHFYTDW